MFRCRQRTPEGCPRLAGMGDYFLKGLKASPTRGWGEQPLVFVKWVRLSSEAGPGWRYLEIEAERRALAHWLMKDHWGFPTRSFRWHPKGPRASSVVWAGGLGSSAKSGRDRTLMTEGTG